MAALGITHTQPFAASALRWVKNVLKNDQTDEKNIH